MRWICDNCGRKYGKKVIEISTYHMDKCEWCGETRAVTEDRDWGYPRLIVNNLNKIEVTKRGNKNS